MEEKKIIITDKGMRVRGDIDPHEIIAYLIEGLCEVWNSEAGAINPTRAGKKIIDLLVEEENNYKLEMIWDFFAKMMSEENEDEDDDE